ncbi:MAG: malate dehydrogenase [Nitrospinota bacterium]|jgi:malate dehydrogenase|nr:malate dehydrogenase [Nitrospinota bacterium]MDP6483444.1 malate dehydrogenase [Nitrospinota bacterium]MDP7386405.1 malate dehydrogenase [Nitrospinota bacterium]
MKRAKITIVGAGNVGATTAHWSASKELGDIVLVDIIEGIPQGKGLDLHQAGPVEGFDSRITGTNDYHATEGSDIVVITAGIARKPGMSREDLLSTNAKIVGGVAREVVKQSPDCILVVVSNPLDTMVWVAKEVTGFPKNRVVGMAGILDTARYRTFLAEAADVSVEDVQALVLGGHGDAMVPLVNFTSIGGIPVTEFLSPDVLEKIVDRTANGGAEIVGHLKTGSAFYAPGAAVTQMVEAIVRDKKRILPCAAYLEGEYGVSGIFLGVPIKLGKDGVERVIELPLSEDEQAALMKSAEGVKASIGLINLDEI